MRKTPLRRKTRLAAKTPLRARGARPRSASKPSAARKPLKKVNSARQAKRRKSYAQKLAAYRRSETFKIVEARAGGRCEHVRPAEIVFDAMRCEAGALFASKLHHHHKTYARFGGDELPTDIIVLCERHHAEAEAKHPTRKHGRAA